MGFYPHGKPGYYSYTEWFETVGHDTIRKAEANTKYPGLDEDSGERVINKALENLRILMDSARAAELSFINATRININNPNNAGDIFRTINLILNSRQTFERGIRYMKELSRVGRNGPAEQTYREVSRFFGSYLESAISEEMKNFMKGSRRTTKAASIALMGEDDIRQLINNIITRALEKTYTKVHDFYGVDDKIRGKFGNRTAARKNEQEVQAIMDMIPIIQQLSQTGAFGDFGDLFNLNRQNLIDWLSGSIHFKRQKGNKYNNAQVDSNYGGNALELITSMIATEIGNINIQNSGLTIVGRHTGGDNQMKADTLLFVGRGVINPDDYLEYVDHNTFGDKVRMQNVDALERYYNNLQNNVEHVIAISDKNYSIKTDFGGINAQEQMNLQNVGLLLEQFGVRHIPELINYLANCGPLMVQGEKVNDAVRTELQSLIAYFLFDNLQVEINGSQKVNVVNLMNVSGMYIPLSVYLEGVYNSIQDVKSNPSSLVSVTISLGGETEQSNWTASTWGKFRESHETQSFISYRILRGIADFITNL